jgi:hypothetical protein
MDKETLGDVLRADKRDQPAQTFNEEAWKHDRDIEEKTAKKIAECLDIVFKAEQELKLKLSPMWVNVKYFISRQEGSLIFFAEFEIRKAMVKIERTFLFDIWHSFSGADADKDYLKRGVERFVRTVQTFE